MSLYSSDLTNYNPNYSNGPSTSSSPELTVHPPSPGDTRSKNARAQARHRAKRKAYVENLENTVHQLRAALASGSSPDVAAQIQFLEQENARLRAESQNLRAQLGGVPSASSSTSPTTASYGYSGESAAGLRLPSVADAMNFRSSTSSATGYASPSYLAEDSSRGRYYETNSDYRKRVSQPYSVPRRESTGGHTYDKDYDADRVSGSGSTSRSSHRSYEASPATPTDGTQGYYSSQLYGTSTSASFPPASNTAGAYVFGEDVKPGATVLSF